jgi:outer membrane protein insertion porin family
MKSITVSEILDRFKERKVGLVVESQYDPNKVQHATVVLKEYLAERGRQYATVEPQISQIPPSSLKVTFNVKEGPKVKVGEINIVGNEVMSSRDAIRAMKNSHPIGVPHSIFLESIWARTFDSTKLEEDKERLRKPIATKATSPQKCSIRMCRSANCRLDTFIFRCFILTVPRFWQI